MGAAHLLEADEDVHCLTMAVVAFDDHIADMQPNPHVDAAVLRHATISIGHRLLNGRRTFDCIYRAAELDQETVAHEFKNAPVITRDGRLDQLRPPLAQALKGAPPHPVP